MIKKQASPKGKSVRVTFAVPAEVASESIAVVGDFNDWKADRGPMKLDAKQGVWKKAVSLKPGSAYEFRYLVDGSEWRNDESADAYVPTPFYSENSVVEV